MKITIHRILLLHAALIAWFLAFPFSLMAQSENDSIHISTDFLNELENSFGFQKEKPKFAPINTIKAIKPDSELLHLWVKDPNANVIATRSKYPMTIYIPGLSNGEFAKGINVPRGYDFNALLSQYLTEEGRTLRHSRDLAKSYKDIMDKFFPIDGSALFNKDDSLALVNKNK